MESKANLWTQVVYRPEAFDVPEEVKVLIDQQNVYGRNIDPVLIRTDLDADGEPEYMFVSLYEHGGYFARFYYLKDGSWRAGNVGQGTQGTVINDINSEILSGEISMQPASFMDLRLGDLVLRPLDSH